MNTTTKVLKRFGLTENEIDIYLECLKNEEVSPFQLAKLTGIPRTTVYDCLMSLSLKGLIELEQSDGFQKQQTRVRGKNPSELRKILQKRRDESFDLEADIVDVLPELKGYFHKAEPNADFKFYPGIEGVKEIYAIMERDDLPHQAYGWSKLLPTDIWGTEDHNKGIMEASKERKELGTRAKELIPLNKWTKHVVSYQYQLDPKYLDTREFRYIESPVFEFYLDLVIKGDYVRMACAEDDEVWGMAIKSKALSQSFKSLYEMTWTMATPVTKEMVESWGVNKFLAAQRNKSKKD